MSSSSSFDELIKTVLSDNTLYSAEELREKFGWEEYFIFALMLAVSAMIGIFFWWKGQKDNAAFLLGEIFFFLFIILPTISMHSNNLNLLSYNYTLNR